jgi:hypothetical protein
MKKSRGIDLNELRGDAPLRPDADDAIGLREVATRVAEALVELRTDASLVIGLEGRWGSGKSSLLSEIEQAISRLDAEQSPTLVQFRPWLVGNRDALLGNLFGALEDAISKIAAAGGDTTRVTVAQAKRAGRAARKFAAGLARAGDAVELAGEVSALAPAKWVGKVMKTGGDWLGREPQARSLADLRTGLISALKALDCRIIVTIDDLDRLEPAEMLEVLRLVRSVGDLPNVLYLLCYDSAILAHGVQKAAQVEDGTAYLEKIVQLTVPVPLPETFQLRHWFETTLAGFAVPRDEDGADRLKTVIDFEGGRRLTTPRSVTRTLDALRFLWPTLNKSGVDLADLVWLQLIKDDEPRLYRWVEEYCAIASELALGTASVDDEERQAILQRLIDLGGEKGFGSLHYRHYFAEQLPSLEIEYSEEGPPFRVLCRVDGGQRDAAIAARRLSSPDHYRLYFALADPSHALKQADFDAFWAAAESSEGAVSQLLVAMQARPPSRALSQTDMLLERIRGRAPETLSMVQCSNILLGFADGLDEVYRTRPFKRFWVTGPWDRAERLIAPLIGRLNADARASIIEPMFAGRALTWLTTVFRREIFAHGRAGERPKPESARLFTEVELDRVAVTMLARYRAMSLEDILAAISPVDVLFAWVQGGGEAELQNVKDHIAGQTEDDAAFLGLLDALRSTVTTSGGRYKPLKPECVEPFINWQTAQARLEQLVVNSAHPELAERAKELLGAIASGRDF